ncbi:MFS transporter [Paraburkholderia nemoris]|uniref:MFS transporter n=1 Tax=Paraburkholderia nemoris TaxID=2793076 RepID=UPI0038B7C5BF
MKAAQLMEAGVAASIETELERKAFRKIAWRILPLFVVSYIFNYIDRTSVSVASLTMNRDIGLSPEQFGYGAGILFIGYCLFDVPSNLAMYRFGARLWIVRIMITWGLVSAAMVFVSGPKSFYALRFLLGVAEAGFFPGVVYYLTHWFPPSYRARMIGWFLVAIPASSLIGAPLSTFLLRLDGVAGMVGWKWMFLLESIPCVLLGVAIAALTTERPAQAGWLTAEEREAVRQRMERETMGGHEVTSFASIFADVRVWLLSGIYLGFSIGSYSLQMWLPLIIKQAGFSNHTAGLLSAVPYLFAVGGMVVWAAYVDKMGRRLLNVVVTCVVGALGFYVSFNSNSLGIAFSGLVLAMIGVNSARAIFWVIPTQFLKGAAAAGGLGLINSIGTAGGFIGPAMMGWFRQETGGFTAGLMAMCASLLVAAVLAAFLMLTPRSE